MTETTACGNQIHELSPRASGMFGDVGTIQHVGATLSAQVLRIGEFPLFRGRLVRERGTAVLYYFYATAKTRCLCGPAFKIATFSPSRSSGFKIYNGSLTTVLFNFKPLDFTRFLAAAAKSRRKNRYGYTRTTVKLTNRTEKGRRWSHLDERY